MMYADDGVFFFSSCSVSEIEMKLSLDLGNVYQWLKRNNLLLNKKTETGCLVFGTHQTLRMSGVAEEISVTLDGAPAKFSTVFKYLGVMIDNHLSFNEHVNFVAGKPGIRSLRPQC